MDIIYDRPHWQKGSNRRLEDSGPSLTFSSAPSGAPSFILSFTLLLVFLSTTALMSVSVSNALLTVVPQPFPMQENDAETCVGHPGCSSIALSGHDLNQLRLSLSLV